MIAIVCVSDDYGMMFNNRRQSSDEELRKYIINRIGTAKLYMNRYSRKQFEDYDNIVVSEAFLEDAKKNDYCFVEENNLSAFQGKLDKIIICKWNRAYPSDVRLSVPLDKYKLVSTTEIKGKSHEKITIEEWSR